MIAKGRYNTMPKLQDIEIMSYYFNIKEVPTLIKSPLRVDNKPSFGIYTRDGFTIKYKDLSKGDSGGVIDLLMSYFNKTYIEIVQMLNIDYDKIKSKSICKIKISNTIDQSKSLKTKDLQVKIREWKSYDLEYWESQGLSLEFLEFGDIYPISHFFINKGENRYTITADKYAYVYVEWFENKPYLKVYQPFNKEHKWISRMYNLFNLINKIPKEGDILIITSSRKDSLCIWKNTGIPSISPQSESQIPDKELIDSLKQRYKQIFILYDNDFQSLENNGRILGNKIANLFNLPQIEIPEELGSKDSSDLYKNKGKQIFKNTIFKLIEDYNNQNSF